MKNLIRKYLNKKLSKRGEIKKNPLRFYFYRWLAELVKDDKKTTDVLMSVASFIHDKDYDYPYQDIIVVGDIVYIVTQRPGLWIGKAGSTHDELEKKLNYNLNGDKVNNYSLTYIEDMFSAKYDVDLSLFVYDKY